MTARTLPGPPLALRPGRSLALRFALAGVASLLAWSLLQLLAPPPHLPWSPAMRLAAERMGEGLSVLGEHCRSRGIEVEPALDPLGTCLVGPELTELFTTLGQVEAKRTTLSPDLAALLVHLLSEAGVRGGDRVAVGASGSFPGLLLGTLVAAEALGARPVAILSLGASSYGATRPEFHLLDIHRVLLAGGVVTTPPVAVSLGGEGDVGRDFDPAFRVALRAELDGTGIAVLDEEDLPRNVARRMAIYEGEGPPSVFVNIGGSEATLGVSPRVLEVPPGLDRDLASAISLPPPEERGVLFEMASRGVPVIHLLNLRGLALRYGLRWDPPALPAPGTTTLRSGEEGGGWAFWLITLAYAGALAAVAFLRRPRAGGAVVSSPRVR